MDSQQLPIPIHNCQNCKEIDKVTETQLNRYKVLTEENIELHSQLIDSRKNLTETCMELLNVRGALNNQRTETLDLHIQRFTEAHHETDDELDFSSSPNADGVITTHSDRLIKFANSMLVVHQSQWRTMKVYTKYLFDQLTEKLMDANKHSGFLLDMNKGLQEDLLTLKKANLKQHRAFFGVVDIMEGLNDRYVEYVHKYNLGDISSLLSRQSRLTLFPGNNELAERDKFIAILKRQQEYMTVEVEEVRRENELEILKQNKHVSTLIHHLKAKQYKFECVRQDRLLRTEILCNNIRCMRKEVQEMKSTLLTASLDPNNMETCKGILDKLDKLESAAQVFQI